MDLPKSDHTEPPLKENTEPCASNNNQGCSNCPASKQLQAVLKRLDALEKGCKQSTWIEVMRQRQHREESARLQNLEAAVKNIRSGGGPAEELVGIAGDDFATDLETLASAHLRAEEHTDQLKRRLCNFTDELEQFNQESAARIANLEWALGAAWKEAAAERTALRSGTEHVELRITAVEARTADRAIVERQADNIRQMWHCLEAQGRFLEEVSEECKALQAASLVSPTAVFPLLGPSACDSPLSCKASTHEQQILALEAKEDEIDAILSRSASHDICDFAAYSQALSGTSQAGLNCSDNQRAAACPTDLAADAELPAAPGAADTGSQTCADQPCPGSHHCFAEAPEVVSPEPQVPSHMAAQIPDLQAQLLELTCRQDRGEIVKTALDMEQKVVARVDSLDKEVHHDVSQLREAVTALDARISSLPGSGTWVLDQLAASVSGLEDSSEVSLARILSQIASLEALFAAQEASFNALRSHRPRNGAEDSPHRADDSCKSDGKETESNAVTENRKVAPGPPSITVVVDAAAQSLDSDDDASRELDVADQRDIALLKQMIKSVSDHAAQLFSQLASAGITQMQAVNTLSARLEALATAAPQPPQRSPSGAQAEEPAGVGPSPTSLLVLQGRVDNVQACLETLLNGISGAKDSRIFSHDHV